MTDTEASTAIAAKPAGELRLWPAVALTGLLWAALTIPMALNPESAKAFIPLMFGMMGSYALMLVWWVFFSRVPWRDRVIGLVVVFGGLALGVMVLYHPSVPGMPLPFFVLPRLMTAVVLVMLLTKPLGWARGRWPVLAALVVALAAPSAVRYGNVNSNFVPTVLPRWQADKEEQLLASLAGAATSEASSSAEEADGEGAAEPYELQPTDWPGFRGMQRDGHMLGGELAADWAEGKPTEVWRHGVGPGWGSFCLVDGLLYTQEQRGEQECVVAYDASTGDQVWSTGVEARFSESIAGPGPRATPTYADGVLYALGAAGELQRLDAKSGAREWSRDVLEDAGMDTPPEWGLASSPLVTPLDDGRSLVIIYACDFRQSKRGSGAVIAYDAVTGEVVWKTASGYHSYSSPHLAVLSGVPQVLMWTNEGLDSLDPATGEKLWSYDWSLDDFGRSIQPLVVDNERLVLSAGYDSGTMPLRVTNAEGKWDVEELWEAPSQKLVPYFNDMVLHEGHLYGVHKKFLVCIHLETGKATWPRKVKRKTKLGNGQVLLDPQSGMLLVTTEDTGEVLLVEANPETFVVRGRLQALEEGTNWNHPVVADGKLYVRHGSEAACYALPAAEVASR